MAGRNRTFRIEPGLQSLLDLAVEGSPLQTEIERWKEQIHAGVIDGDTRSVLIALGWITMRDTRVQPIASPLRAPEKKPKVNDVPHEAPTPTT